MVILGTLGAVVSSIIFRAVQDYATVSAGSQVQFDLSSAMDRVDRELREIALKAGGGVRPDITSVNPTAIIFATSKSFALSGTQLLFTDSAGGPLPLLDNVSAFNVQAFDQSNASLGASVSGAACDNIRRLLVTITVTRAGATDSLRTKIFLRNTMSGAGS